MAVASNTRTIWDFWAPRYEGLWVQRFSLGPSRELIHHHLDEHLPGARRILDVGCGVGQLAHELAVRRPEAQVVGCDTSAAMIARARADYSAPNLRFLHAQLEDVPPGDGYDAITCTHALPYFPDKPAAMARFHALLRPGGRLLVLQANTEGLYDRLWLLVVKLTTTPAVYDSAARLHAYMAAAGFTPGEVRSIHKLFFIPSIQLVEGVR